MIQIAGILNVNGDSFWEPSRVCAEDISDRAGRMLEEGADFLDIGAFSSRPGADIPSPQEEWQRLAPALKAVKRDFPEADISIDTIHSETVLRAVDLAGPLTVNDISAGRLDPMMLETVGRLGLPYIATHSKGTPRTMQGMADYRDIVTEVRDFFREFGRIAAEHGITDWILDPGFGFAKTTEQNYALLQGLDRIGDPGRRIMVGVSRKSMIYKVVGGTPEDVLASTQVVQFRSLEKGADILRVHDVAEAVKTVKLYRAMYTSSPGAQK